MKEKSIKWVVLNVIILLSFDLCAQTYKLSAPKGYSNYAWYKTNLITGIGSIIGGANEDTILISDAGVYYCEFDTKICKRKSDFVVLVSRCQTNGDTSVILNAATTAAGSYQWFKNGTALLGEIGANKLVTYREESDYYAQVFNGWCTYKTEKFIVRALNSGVADISAITLNCK